MLGGDGERGSGTLRMTRDTATRRLAADRARCARRRCGGGKQPPAPAALTIAVIPKGTTHVFWQSIHAGAEQAGKELGVDDHLARTAARGRPRRAGLRGRGLRQPRRLGHRARAARRGRRWCSRSSEAQQQKIPVVIFDSGLKGDDYVSFVATDNLKGGRMGGERLAQSLGGKGKVILLRYAEGTTAPASASRASSTR